MGLWQWLFGAGKDPADTKRRTASGVPGYYDNLAYNPADPRHASPSHVEIGAAAPDGSGAAGGGVDAGGPSGGC